ncbi:hypothetical protein [Bacillus velezensis]|uniref:hypothetical protein n=1 Tax=Bacillus velezensis TaxID=492670 RepID=UPI00131A15E6|nr:hypothetical protein [Bacillus velezensis]
MRSWSKGKVGRSASASLGYCNTGGEDLRLKERVCFRKTRRVQGNAGDRGLHPGYCSTGGEEQELKKRGQIRKTRQDQGNVAVSRRREAGRKVKSADRRPHPWAIATPAAKTCG